MEVTNKKGKKEKEMELTVWFPNYQWNGEMREFDDKHAFFNFYESTVLKLLYGRRNEGIVEALTDLLHNHAQCIVYLLKLGTGDVAEKRPYWSTSWIATLLKRWEEKKKMKLSVGEDK